MNNITDKLNEAGLKVFEGPAALEQLSIKLTAETRLIREVHLRGMLAGITLARQGIPLDYLEKSVRDKLAK